MTITVELPTATEEKLRDKANARGLELPAYLQLLAEEDAEKNESGEDLFVDYPALGAGSSEDLLRIRAGVERGLEDFAAGRFKSADDADAWLKARNAIPD